MKREDSTARRRRLIVETAAECFIRGGFHQTSIRDIAKKAGISLGNLYNHFESKAQLIIEIASIEAEEQAALIDTLAKEQGGVQSVLNLLEAVFDQASKIENAVLYAEITTEAIRNEEVAACFETNRKQLVRAIADRLKDGLPEEGDASELSALLLDFVEAASLRAAFENGKSRAAIKQALFRSIETILAERS